MVPADRVREAGDSIAYWASTTRTPEKLPWREKRTAYGIFLAEFLLTRTRSDLVARVFGELLSSYPDIKSLASAAPHELESLLRPLGLVKRVPMLLAAARHIQNVSLGEIPSGQAELEAIPGIGRYAAAAIRAFAFGERIVPPDVNVLRFLSRVTGLPMVHPTRGSRELLSLVSELMSEYSSPTPEEILDFCRTVCRPRSPRCQSCPILNRCAWGQETHHTQD
jgi:A/G-specific adenine glycosylase